MKFKKVRPTPLLQILRAREKLNAVTCRYSDLSLSPKFSGPNEKPKSLAPQYDDQPILM
uniref:Uncharacterized protein n=1 Tax=Rhizophora mucronata TaxID=61149 RepID=A0A2P2N3K7_RHIMU